MSVLTSAPAAGVPRLKVTQVRVLRSEWTKFRSVRSTMWTLLIALVLMIGIGALFAAVNASQYHGFSAADKASFNPVSVSLSGTTFAVIAFGVLGVLTMSGEYGTGMIRSSLTVVPRRLPVLWGKLCVFAAVVFTTSLAASFTTFWLGQALLTSHHLGVSISSPGALRSVVGAALYITVAGLLGVTLGALFRNTAAGIATFAGVFFVLPPLTNLLPSSITNHLSQYLPEAAGSVLWGETEGVSHALSPWTGFAVLCLYAVIFIAAAAWRLGHSDA
ncbi:MAG: ABC transporter permease subunit [Streptosporangiaceae bacterium]|jgi:ABC-2 type transport system permease protein